MMHSILILMIASSPIQPPEQLEFATPDPPEVVVIGAGSIPNFLLSIFIHESGHALAAKATGMDVVGYRPYPAIECGGTGFGCVDVNYRGANVHQRMLFYGGGMFATRLLAESIDTLMNHVDMHPRVKQLNASLYFITRLDSVRYVLRCAVSSWVNHPTDSTYDPQTIAQEITPNREKQKWVYLGMAGVVILDLLLDWDEVRTNWNRLWLK